MTFLHDLWICILPMFIFPAPTLPGKGKATRATRPPRVSANMCHLVWLNQCLRPTCWGYLKIQLFCFAPSSAMEIAWPSCLTMSPLTKSLFWWPSGEVSGIWCEVGFPNFFGLTKADSEKQPWQIEAMISNTVDCLDFGTFPPPKKAEVSHRLLTTISWLGYSWTFRLALSHDRLTLLQSLWTVSTVTKQKVLSCSYFSWYSLILIDTLYCVFSSFSESSDHLTILTRIFVGMSSFHFIASQKIYCDCWGAMAGRCATWTGAVRSRGMQMCSCWTPICQLLK